MFQLLAGFLGMLVRVLMADLNSSW